MCIIFRYAVYGKTFVASEKMKQLNESLNIIVCPKSVVDTWETHIKLYYPEYQVVKYEISKDTTLKTVIIINYDLIWRKEEFLKLKDYTLILDESQFIKNTTTARTKFIMKLQFKNLILCSGTPTGGKYEELLTQCKLLGWNVTKKIFWNMYVDYILINMGGFKIPKITGYKNVEHLRHRLAEYGAVFMKTEEAINLPEQMDNIICVKNTEEYSKFKKDRIVDIDNKTLIGDTSFTKMLYLRQLASQYNKNKTDALKDIIESTADRLIIFYNFNEEKKQILDILDRPISILSGDMKDLRHYENKDNSITLVQYQAGATGVNLQKANKIIYYSLPLSSELFEQSKKRIHRIRTKKYLFLLLLNY